MSFRTDDTSSRSSFNPIDKDAKQPADPKLKETVSGRLAGEMPPVAAAAVPDPKSTPPLSEDHKQGLPRGEVGDKSAKDVAQRLHSQDNTRRTSETSTKNFFGAIGRGIGTLAQAYREGISLLKDDFKNLISTSEGEQKTASEIPIIRTSKRINSAIENATVLAPQGPTRIKVGDRMEDLTLTGEIKLVKELQVGKMERPLPCLIMTEADFLTIRNTIHQGAFGSDFAALPNGTVVVWKCPQDLYSIEAFKITDTTTLAVGTYGVGTLIGEKATKFRTDFKDKNTPPVHHLEPISPPAKGANRPKIAMIGMGMLHANYLAPTGAETERVAQANTKLKNVNICIVRVSSQHGYVFACPAQPPKPAEPLTVDKLVELLKGENRDEIINALKLVLGEDAVKQVNIDKWANNYIDHYGSS